MQLCIFQGGNSQWINPMHFDPHQVDFWGCLLTIMCHSAVPVPSLKFLVFKSYQVVKTLYVFLNKYILFQLKLRLCMMFDVWDLIFSFRVWWSVFLSLGALFPVIYGCGILWLTFLISKNAHALFVCSALGVCLYTLKQGTKRAKIHFAPAIDLSVCRVPVH